MNPKSMTRLDAMRRLACAVVLLSLGGAVTGTVSAEQGARLDDPWLAKLEGRWDLVREIRGEVVRNTFEARWVLNHQFLQLHMLDVAGTGGSSCNCTCSTSRRRPATRRW